jgi:hypothetical protein
MRIHKNKTESISLAIEDDNINRGTLWVLLIGIFLASFSLLAFEITLTRILSVMLYYHFVFIVISLALLGLGAGGIFIHFFRRRIPRSGGRFGSLALFTSLFSLSISLSVIVLTRFSADSLVLYSFLLFVPFFFAGALFAETFLAFPALSSKVYGMDLLGAAAGSLGVVLILNNFGGINSSFLFALFASAAAVLFAGRAQGINFKRFILPATSFLIIASLFGANLTGLQPVGLPVGANPAKEMNHALSAPSLRGEIIETRWSAFGRTDLVAFRDNPEVMNIFLDGTAGMMMYQFNGDFKNPEPRIGSLKTSFPGYLPFSFLQEEEERNSALIIGPGGGRDILLALLADVGRVTAVEVNEDLVDIVSEYAWYNGGIYTDLENVTIIVDEGRHFLKRQKDKYDIIMLSLPITKTSRSLEGFALTESFLFTTDSFDDYLEHLTDEGRLIVVAHDMVEISRLLSISLETLKQQGVNGKAAMEQIYIVGSDTFPVFVLQKTPLELTEMVSVHQSIHQLGYDPISSYLPNIRRGSCTSHIEGNRFNECAMFSPFFLALGTGAITFDDLDGSYTEHGLDLSPVTDDSPFFYKFEAGIPQSVSLVVWSSAAMLLIVMFASLFYLRRRSDYRKAKQSKTTIVNISLFRFVTFFSMLGIGFMLVEISTIQRFILFLGQPVLSLSVLLFSLLVGAGIGSMYSGRFTSEKIVKVITVATISIVAVLVIYAFSLPVILEQLLGLELAIRILATVAMLTPLGFLMGFLFPLGLRLLKEMRMEGYIPWMWGINGISSVLGSALTIVVAISFGFTEALLLGAACYSIVFFTLQRVSIREIQQGQEVILMNK